MSKITVLGPGGWGIALALRAFANGHEVCMWSPFTEEVERLNNTRANERLLPGVTIPKGITISDDISVAESSQLTILATPSKAIRSAAKELGKVKNFGIVVSVSKGVEDSTFLRLSEVIEQELPQASVAVLSGPSHAEEVSRDVPTSLVCASKSIAVASLVQDMLSSKYLRIYTSEDITGVELGGALKNIIAICSGLCNGLKLGDNTRAALITRGLAEMSRLGVCMGAKEHTFAGLAGIGDLIVTCTSVHSRNNRFGYMVGTGMPVEDALKEVGTVEGYYATLVAYKLAGKHHIEMPIIEECYNILYNNKPVGTAVSDLMTRPRRQEH